MLLSASRRADTTLVATGLAVILCGVSLMLAHRAVLSGVKLAEMRSRFVSSVTHELKTPLANIRALAGTLARESQGSSERYKAYPDLLIQEANDLGRLVDNLLAYARITDVTETYSFEAMAAAELVEEALRSFQPRLLEGGGLGLAIVSKVVADHGGTLTVDSELGVGTRCTIALPAC